MTEREITDAVLDGKKVKWNTVTGDIRTLFYTKNPEHKLCCVIQQDVTNELHICEQLDKVELA